MAIAINGTDGNPLTARDVDASANNVIYIEGRLAFSGNYAAGGDTLDWTTVAGQIPSTSCLQVWIGSQGGLLTVNYFGVGGPATALNAWKVKISSGTFGTELAAGAYPAGVTGDVVAFGAVFRKLQ